MIFTCLFRSSVMREIWIFFLPMAATVYNFSRLQIEGCFAITQPMLKLLTRLAEFILFLPFCSNKQLYISLLNDKIFLVQTFRRCFYWMLKDNIFSKFFQLRSRDDEHKVSECHHNQISQKQQQVQRKIIWFSSSFHCSFNFDSSNLIWFVILCKFWWRKKFKVISK